MGGKKMRGGKSPFFEETSPFWRGPERVLVVGTPVAPERLAPHRRNAGHSCWGGTQAL